METIKIIDDWIDSAQLICTKTDRKTKYDFSNFTFPLKFASKIYRHYLTLQKAKNDQVNVEILINKLNNDYSPQNLEKIIEKDDTLKSAKKLLKVRREIIKAFETGIYPYIDGFQTEEELDEESMLDDKNIDTTDMPDLESEESATEGKGLKVLTLNQILRRLPFSLAQLKGGNSSEKLKNEIRQLLYSLYRSKKLTKQLYKSLVDII